ncbi:MAG: hypothetical protein AAFU53_15205 [Cyanobacteria bacterium J06632_3]
MTSVQPGQALASPARPTAGLAAYCKGFASGLETASRKERALFLYHQGVVNSHNAAAAYQAGNESSTQFLQFLEATGNEPSQDVELRILLPRVFGELCSFTRQRQMMANAQ